MIRKSALFAFLAVFAVLMGVAGLASAQGTDKTDKKIPSNLNPPEGSVLLFELQAEGVQIYTCDVDPDDASAYVWIFKAPEADLLNRRGELAGTHFGGPTWQGFDGSSVAGSVLERADSPDKGSIPWLLLEAKEHTGSGAFSTISYVQRLNTVGGAAPTAGCDESYAGSEVQQPYEATYAFYYSTEPLTVDAEPGY